ncbi:flagellar basal body L-ring protein FlgH [Halanaerocella petrolearia]
MFKKVGGLFLLLLLFVSTIGQAASLWDDSKPMYSTNKAYKAGDILTVIVSENATANQQASTDVSQSNQANAGAGTGILDFINPFGFNESDSSTATGTTSRSGNLSAKVTVEVEKVLDNGNLKIIGKKKININDEEQKIKLHGVIRPGDISPDNTIDSTKIAQLDINYEGQGAVADKQKPGIITRILNWLF